MPRFCLCRSPQQIDHHRIAVDQAAILGAVTDQMKLATPLLAAKVHAPFAFTQSL